MYMSLLGLYRTYIFVCVYTRFFAFGVGGWLYKLLCALHAHNSFRGGGWGLRSHILPRRPDKRHVLGPRSGGGTPSLREVRAEGWSELSPRCMGAAARRAGLSPLFCDAPISRRPVCFLMHTLPPFGPAELGGFFLEFLRTDSEFGASRPLRERIRGHRGSISLRSFFSRH